MKNKKLYLSIVIPIFVVSLIFTFFSYYALSVVDKANANELIDSRIEKIKSRIVEDNSELDIFKNQLISEYKSKTQTLALIIAQTPSIINDELSLEELRINMGAEEIYISNEKGIIVNSSKISNEHYIETEFVYAVNNFNYKKTIIKSNENEDVFTVGVSRRDQKGIIQANFISKNYNKILKYYDISNVTSEYPLLKKGITAIIDANDGHYLSHTNFKLTNTLSAIPLDKFQKNVGTISSNSTKSNVIIRYQKYKDYIILGIVDKSEVYSRRNSVTIWTILCCLSLSLTSILSIRKHLIDNDIKSKNTKGPD